MKLLRLSSDSQVYLTDRFQEIGKLNIVLKEGNLYEKAGLKVVERREFEENPMAYDLDALQTEIESGALSQKEVAEKRKYHSQIKVAQERWSKLAGQHLPEDLTIGKTGLYTMVYDMGPSLFFEFDESRGDQVGRILLGYK